MLSIWGAICTVICGCGGAGRPLPDAPAVFYPPLPERPRIQFLRSLSSADDFVPPPSALERFVVGQEQAEEDRKMRSVVRPYGVALWKGKLYVCDSGGGKVAAFDFERREFRTFGRQRGENIHVRAPVNVSIATNGQKFVTDPMLGQVLVYDPDDQLAGTVKLPEGSKPCDAVWHEGELFVACLKSNCILVLDPRSGRVLRRVGKAGSSPGEFVWPTNLAFGPEGYLYVCDTLNARVQAFNRDGNLVKIVGSRGLALGKMVRPKGIAVDRAGRLYVADAAALPTTLGVNPQHTIMGLAKYRAEQLLSQAA